MMKYRIFLLEVLLALSFATNSHAYEVNENVTGDAIVVIEDETSEAENSASTSWRSKTEEIILNALSLTGIQYKRGGKTPESGFDCSGFVGYVFSQAANISLPPTARAISQIGKSVNKDQLQPGDLVFFNTLKSAFSHVGIYIGDNKFIHAPRTGGSVRVENMQETYWSRRFNGAQRIEPKTENAN